MSKVFVLRTHALLSSRTSTLKFGDDNEIVIPIGVLEELKNVQEGSFEKKRIARELLEYINSFPALKLISESGVEQKNGSILRVCNQYKGAAIHFEDLGKSGNETLDICVGIRDQEKKDVVLVTNNPVLQFRARMQSIRAENFKDEIFPKLKDQYTGRGKIFVSKSDMDSFYKNGFIRYAEIAEYNQEDFVPNKFFIITDSINSALGVCKEDKIVKLKYQDKYPYGITPKNVGQKFMLEALQDEDCPLIIIKGSAGTGKTFCALAAGLENTFNNNKYSRILVTRSVTASEQYGFLPGDIEEKLSPYLAGIKDNLSILCNADKKSRDFKTSEKDAIESGEYFFEKDIVQIQAIGFLRGRSIVDTYFIIDETQNIEPATIKSIVTRAAEGSKFIFLGDPTQIDNQNLTERLNGLVYLSEKMKGNHLCAQVTLLENESVRSELAKEAAKIL